MFILTVPGFLPVYRHLSINKCLTGVYFSCIGFLSSIQTPIHQQGFVRCLFQLYRVSFQYTDIYPSTRVLQVFILAVPGFLSVYRHLSINKVFTCVYFSCTGFPLSLQTPIHQQGFDMCLFQLYWVSSQFTDTYPSTRFLHVFSLTVLGFLSVHRHLSINKGLTGFYFSCAGFPLSSQTPIHQQGFCRCLFKLYRVSSHFTDTYPSTRVLQVFILALLGFLSVYRHLPIYKVFTCVQFNCAGLPLSLQTPIHQQGFDRCLFQLYWVSSQFTDTSPSTSV